MAFCEERALLSGVTGPTEKAALAVAGGFGISGSGDIVPDGTADFGANFRKRLILLIIFPGDVCDSRGRCPDFR